MLGGAKLGMSPGFTMIELVIVLAIVSTLVVLAFLGQGQFRANARFSDSVDRTVSALSNAQNESGTTVNENPSGGDMQDEVFFGMLTEFKSSEPTKIFFTPMYIQGRAEICGASCEIETKPNLSYEFESPWGAEYEPEDAVAIQSKKVVFARNPINGANIIYNLPGNWTSVQLSDYGEYFNIPKVDAKVNVTDDAGNIACITIGVSSRSIAKAQGAPC